MFNRSKLWAAALLAAVFGAGMMAGWAIQARADDRGSRGYRRGPDAMVNYLTGELDLSAAQQDSVRAVFARHKPAMKALWEKVHPQMDSLRQVMRNEITAQLQPAQQARYRELLADRHRHDSTKATDTTTRSAN